MWSEKVRHAPEAMEGDSEKTNISYFHYWVDSEGMAKTESWKNSKTLISQEDYEKLDETQKEGKYSLDKTESYFTLFESLLAPKSNPLLAVKELCFAKQGSMNSEEFHAHVVKIVKRCKFHMVHHLPDPAGHTKKMKSHTVPVQFQYGAHSPKDGNSFQDHHTLCNSNDSNAGRFSTCTLVPVQNTSQSGPPKKGPSGNPFSWACTVQRPGTKP